MKPKHQIFKDAKVDNVERLIVNAETNRVIAKIPLYHDQNSQKIIDLFIAAPDLLRACKKVFKALERSENQDLKAEVYEAIQKAEGN